jgi:hypothetical protein
MNEHGRTRTDRDRAARRNYVLMCVVATVVMTVLLAAVTVLINE